MSAPNFVPLSVAELLERPDPRWRIEGLLVEKTFYVVYGPSGSGKTFLALDWALSVATGLPWRGHAVRGGGPVVYVTAEGGGGLKHRVAAWLAAKGKSMIDLHAVSFVLANVNLMDEDEVAALTRMLGELLEGRQPALLVFDTLNAMMPGGDENSPSDMGAALQGIRRVRSAMNDADVLVLHHTGWNPARERGHSSLRATADAMLGVAGDPENPFSVRELTCKKQRDEGPFAPIRFGLERMERSLVITDPPSAQPARDKVLDALSAEPRTAEEIADRLGIAARSVRRRVAPYITAGAAHRVPGTGDGKSNPARYALGPWWRAKKRAK